MFQFLFPGPSLSGIYFVKYSSSVFSSFTIHHLSREKLPKAWGKQKPIAWLFQFLSQEICCQVSDRIALSSNQCITLISFLESCITTRVVCWTFSRMKLIQNRMQLVPSMRPNSQIANVKNESESNLSKHIFRDQTHQLLGFSHIQ